MNSRRRSGLSWFLALAAVAITGTEGCRRIDPSEGSERSDYEAQAIWSIESDKGGPSELVQTSPFAGAILRIQKPVDMSTYKTMEHFFFATRDRQ